MHDNKEIMSDFLATIIRAVSKGSSRGYAMMAIKKYIKQQGKKYPFLDAIQTGTLSENPEEIVLDDKINEADPKKVGLFIAESVNALFSDLFKHWLSRELSPTLAEDLKNLGVRIKL